MNKSVMKFIKTVKRGFGKRSPEILLGIGIASGITATVLAVKATPKALELLTEKRYEKYGDTLKEDDSYDDMPELKPVEVVKATWKCYIPAVISGAASIACLLGSHSVNAKRNAALATAYKLSETALNEYREKVVEEIGEEKEKVIRDKVSQKHLDETPVSKNEVIITGTGKQLCYDGISGRYFESDIQTIRAAVNKINETMVYEMYAALNDFYNEIGFASNSIDNKCDRTEGCDKSRDGLNLQILLINNICEAAVQHGYDELCDLSDSEGLIASLEDWIKINNLEDFCHVVYVDDPDCLCGIKIGRKENTSDGSNR